MKMKYSVVRFVPNPARGEALNVGVLVIESDTNTGHLELAIDPHRLRAISDKPLIAAINSYLQDWKVQIESSSNIGSSRLLSEEWLYNRVITANNLLQFSSPAPVLAESVAEAIALLSEQFLLPAPEERPRSPVTRKHAIIALRNAYSDFGLNRGTDFVERPLIKTKSYREVMDFAVMNGTAVQIAQTFNFRQRNIGSLSETIKAWAWTVNDIRERGGRGEWRDRTFLVPEKVDVEVAYIEPDTSEGGDALAEALHAFREVHARSTSIEGVQKAAQRASKALATHANH